MQKFTLREWKPEDRESLAKYANNEKIACNLRNVFPCPYSFSDADFYIGDCIAREGNRQICRAIDVNGEAVGSIGVFLMSDVNEKSAEIGYWLGEPFWGKGIMTEAVKRICAEAFKKFDLERIYADVFERNKGSRRVLEKCGFSFEGTLRNSVFKNGEVLNACSYSLLKDEL